MKLQVFAFLSLSLGFVSAQQLQFPNPGRIHAYHTDNINTANETNKVGCVSNAGKLTVSNCGVFVQSVTWPNALYSNVGNCSFQDDNEPLNTDSIYGGGDHALNCYATTPIINDVIYYLPMSSGKKWLCTGDVDCYFDAKKAPAAGESLPFWIFRWGSQQMGITPGHIQVALRWEDI